MIIDLLDRVRRESGRSDLDNATMLGWLNTYKIKLQRERRLFLSDNTSQITMKMNTRSTGLPSNYISLVAIRRQQPEVSAEVVDFWGNRHTILKEATLHHWIRREEFLDRFPTKRTDGAPYTGAVNDFMLQGSSIIWGPIPSEDESLFIDYYGLNPKYDAINYITDKFLDYYEDGFFSYLMEQVFKLWVPDEKKMKVHVADRESAEVSLRKFQISREMPMETDINLPDN